MKIGDARIDHPRSFVVSLFRDGARLVIRVQVKGEHL